MKSSEYAEYDTPTRGAEVPTITTEMIHAAERALIRHAVAEEQEIEPAAVTEDAIDSELAEIREEDEANRAEKPEAASLDQIFAEVLAAALNAAEVSA